MTNPKRTGLFHRYAETMSREEAIEVYETWLFHVRYYHPKLDILFHNVTIPTFFLPVPMELLQETPEIIKNYTNSQGPCEDEKMINDNIENFAHRYYPRTGNDREIIKGAGKAILTDNSFEEIMSKIEKNKDDWYFEYKEL